MDDRISQQSNDYTNNCKDIFFLMQDNITTNVTAVFVGDGPFDAEKTAKLKIFRTNLVAVSDMFSVAVSHRVHVTAQDANGNIAVPITMDLVQVSVFLDVAETVPLEDWPQT